MRSQLSDSLLPILRKGERRSAGGVIVPADTVRTSSGLVVPASLSSHTTLQEKLIWTIANDDRKFFDSLDDTEKEIAVEILREMQQDPDLKSTTLDAIWEIDYWQKPADIATFLDDPYYMGDITRELYPQWREDLHTVFAPGTRYVEWIFGGSIGCFTGDTRIRLADGSSPTLRSLASGSHGMSFWVYSVDAAGNTVPGLATAARRTKSSAELVEVILTSGARERCTPDHPWMLPDGSYAEAASLTGRTVLKSGHRVSRVSKLTEREDVYDITVARHHNYALASGAIVHNCGKSTAAAVAMTYIIHKNGCLRDPQRFYNLMKGAAIVFGIFSVTKAQVQDVGYTKIKSFIDSIPWFQEQYPRTANLESRVAFTKHKMEIKTGSKAFHAIGADVLSFYMDEVNFMGNSSSGKEDQEQAAAIYNNAKMRLRSRFQKPGGSVAGMTFLISSKKSTASFLETHLEASKDDIRQGYTYVSEYSLWDVKDKRNYTLPTFQVEVGDKVYPSRILQEGEKPRDGAKVINVPGEYHADFQRSVDQSLRDLAGVATHGVSPLFRGNKVIQDAVDPLRKHPFTRPEFTISTSNDLQISTFLMMERLFRVRGSRYTMRTNPMCPRFWHLDIGLTGDAAALAIGHVNGHRKVDRIRPDGTYYVDEIPMIYADIMLRIVPPRGAEIDLSKIRSFLINLRDLGVPLLRGTVDGYQSRDTIQILTKLGFEVGYLSVDADDAAYTSLCQSFHEGRVSIYDYPPLILELSELEHDIDAHKVDHPKKREDGSPGRKDVADAFCGMHYGCMNDHRASKSVADVMPGWKRLSGDELANRIRMAGASSDIPWADLDKDLINIRRRR